MTTRPPISFGRLVRYAIQGTALGLVIATIVLLLTVNRDTVRELRSVPWRYLPLLFGLVGCAWTAAGARIWLLTRSLGYRLGFRRSVAIAVAAEFGVAASPAGMGGTVVRLTLMKRVGIPLMSGTSLLAADVTLDVLFFAGLVPFALWIVVRDPAWREMLANMHTLPLFAFIASVASLTALSVFLVRSHRWMRTVSAASGRSALGRRLRLPARVRKARSVLLRTARKVLHDGRHLFRHRKGVLLAGLALAAIQWTCRYGILPLLLFAFHSGKNPLPLMLIQGFLFTFSLMLVIPGGGGGIEILTTAVLAYFVPGHVVGVILVLWRFFTYHLSLLVGGPVFFGAFGRQEIGQDAEHALAATPPGGP